MNQWLSLLSVALCAGAISGLIGTGASLLLLPILVPMFGAVEAIPIMAVAGFIANCARAFAWRRQIVWPAVFAYVLPGVPAAALGVYTLVQLPRGLPELLLGIFMMLLVPLRRVAKASLKEIGLPELALAGAFVGFLTGIFLSTGPLSVPAFLAFGLARGGFIGTEATASLIVQAGKILSFHELGAFSPENMAKGVVVGSALMLGTFASRPMISHVSDTHFRLAMDLVTLASGLWILSLGLRAIYGLELR